MIFIKFNGISNLGTLHNHIDPHLQLGAEVSIGIESTILESDWCFTSTMKNL
jgi:hypothetical protein